MGRESKRLIVNNKKARSDHFILETFETGIEPFGMEAEMLHMGHCFVREGWVNTRDGEVFIYGAHINPYEKGNIFNKGPPRVWKLLMHRSEIHCPIGTTKEKGLMLAPLEVYLKGRPIKMKIGLIQGKKKYDKHMTTVKNDARRDSEWNLRGSMRY